MNRARSLAPADILRKFRDLTRRALMNGSWGEEEAEYGARMLQRGLEHPRERVQGIL